ncbi:proline/serine-rich protein [Mycena rebaudengoi]|nr:proline/serine-rich protein [Mycena rebaudengoi]
MATPAPPTAASGPSRTKDWARTGEPGSAFNGIGRGGRGGGRGRNRGGRGGRGAAASSSARPSSTTEKPAATAAASGVRASSTTDKPVVNAGSSAKTPSGSTPSTEKPSVPPAAPSRSKGPSRKSSAARSVIPTVVVGPSAPSVDASPAARPSNRRRRSQQLSKGNGLKVNVAASSQDDGLLRPQNRLVPHSAPPPSKDTPPHLAGSFDMRNNIDALVERVRAVAMDRPSTPGSHIDWAGDDDEGLPDLDDWGVNTAGTSVADKDEMISPIIVDGLKPLPEPVAKPPTPLGDRKEEVAVPFIMEDQKETVKVPLHPSLPPKPVLIPGSVSTPPHRRGVSTPQKPAVKPDTAVPESPTAPGNSGTQQSHVAEASQQPGSGEKLDDNDDASSDSGREGLAASIHAPSLSNSLSVPSKPGTPPHQPRNFHPTHNRAQTIGRPPYFPQSGPVNFNPRFTRSGTSTPRGGFNPGGHHNRTHSSPPAGSVLSNHRPPHARPVITGDAISRLARTIAASPSGRTQAPIPASNI